MPDMRYLEAKLIFLAYASDVFGRYYDDPAEFKRQFEQIKTDQDQNRFLKLASFYKFLIKEGQYTHIGGAEPIRIDYIDETYKYIGLMSLIEALRSQEEYRDFYQWLNRKETRSSVFPIEDASQLGQHYQEYKKHHGAAQKASTSPLRF